jgi:plasmid maintenance system antidote protein VapI
VIQVRSVNGAHLKRILSVNFPRLYAVAIPQMARALGISKRTLYAYIQEERRVPEYVEERIINLYGEIPESGWRTVEARGLHTITPTADPNAPEAQALDLTVSADANWVEIAQASVMAVATKLHGHAMGEWVGHPDMLDVDGNPLDLVTECRRCGMLVAIDAGLREVNGFAWRAFCGSDNLWRGAR